MCPNISLVACVKLDLTSVNFIKQTPKRAAVVALVFLRTRVQPSSQRSLGTTACPHLKPFQVSILP